MEWYALVCYMANIVIVGVVGNQRDCGAFHPVILSLLFSPLAGLIIIAGSEHKHKMTLDKEILARLPKKEP